MPCSLVNTPPVIFIKVVCGIKIDRRVFYSTSTLQKYHKIPNINPGSNLIRLARNYAEWEVYRVCGLILFSTTCETVDNFLTYVVTGEYNNTIFQIILNF